MPWYATVVLGIGGSALGGIIARILLGTAGGFVFAFLGAVILLYGYRGFLRVRHGAPIRWWWRTATRRAPSCASSRRRAARSIWLWRRPPDWWRHGRTEFRPTTCRSSDR